MIYSTDNQILHVAHISKLTNVVWDQGLCSVNSPLPPITFIFQEVKTEYSKGPHQYGSVEDSAMLGDSKYCTPVAKFKRVWLHSVSALDIYSFSSEGLEEREF